MTRRLTRSGQHDAFYAGYSCALSVALSGEDGTSTRYVEAIDCVNAAEFLAWAKKNDDIEVPRIKQAMRFIRERDKMRSCAAATPEGP